jgi:hypothetical protein
MTANAAGTNGLTCLPKHGEVVNKSCLASTIARRPFIEHSDRGAMELLNMIFYTKIIFLQKLSLGLDNAVYKYAKICYYYKIRIKIILCLSLCIF